MLSCVPIFIVELPTINTNLAEVYYASGQDDKALILIKANLKELSQNNFKDQKKKSSTSRTHSHGRII